MSLQIHRLPYQRSGVALFSRLRALPWAMWLDGGGPGHGRYDVFVAAPRETLISRNGQVESGGPEGRGALAGDPLALLQARLAERPRERHALPFTGGAVGYFGYELGARLEGLSDPRAGLPEMAVALYDWAVVSDHEAGETVWVGPPGEWRAFDRVRGLLEGAEPAAEGCVFAEPHMRPERADYAAAFARVQSYIRAGDCYQVNLARPFRAVYRGDPWAAYAQLRQLSPAPFGAYLELPFARILSNSPERFLRLRDGRVETRPIKGTRPRRMDPAADRRERDALAHSPKDRAENVMIVDLLRNDLGKSCEFGSVRVSQLCEVESYASVHHLVSAVEGRLRPGVGATELLHGCLPGGSITGAPKRRAMEIIQELEPAPRGVYCGAIGYLGYDGGMDTNIAIRTVVCSGDEAVYWAGGGVVADSREPAEFQEIYDKAAAFLRLVEACGSALS